jgi:hypothetical protein
VVLDYLVEAVRVGQEKYKKESKEPSGHTDQAKSGKLHKDKKDDVASAAEASAKKSSTKKAKHVPEAPVAQEEVIDTVVVPPLSLSDENSNVNLLDDEEEDF